MNRIATNLLQEQLTIAHRIVTSRPHAREIGAEDVLRLARVTIELHEKLVSGTPFPSVWLVGALRASRERANAS